MAPPATSVQQKPFASGVVAVSNTNTTTTLRTFVLAVESPRMKVHSSQSLRIRLVAPSQSVDKHKMQYSTWITTLQTCQNQQRACVGEAVQCTVRTCTAFSNKLILPENMLATTALLSRLATPCQPLSDTCEGNTRACLQQTADIAAAACSSPNKSSTLLVHKCY